MVSRVVNATARLQTEAMVVTRYLLAPDTTSRETGAVDLDQSMGSDAENVLRQTPVPVLLVRGAKPRR